MAQVRAVFSRGKFSVQLLSIGNEAPASASGTPSSPHLSLPLPLPPPKPLLIATPMGEGEYPVLILFHGYLLSNSFYSQLCQYVASHGFIVVAPQLYQFSGPDSEDEIRSAAATIDWLNDGLSNVLPLLVRPRLTKIAVAGHSRGGKVAFALALRPAKTILEISAVIGIDPVDGAGKGNQTKPPILTYIPHSFDLRMPGLVIGSGLGELRANPLLPPCAPEGVNHKNFFEECLAPAYHFVAKEYGHLDMLDDETKGVIGKATYCLCKKGSARTPMRSFVGGAITAFMKAYLEGDDQMLHALADFAKFSPVEIVAEAETESKVELERDKSIMLIEALHNLVFN